MMQLSLFEWADAQPRAEQRPSAQIIDVMPALIGKIAAEPVWPPTPKAGEIISLRMRRHERALENARGQAASNADQNTGHVA